MPALRPESPTNYDTDDQFESRDKRKRPRPAEDDHHGHRTKSSLNECEEINSSLRPRLDSERDSAGESWPARSASPASSVDHGETARPARLAETPSLIDRSAAPDVDVEFDPSDLALATVPGMMFDPKSRAFSTEELRPQPIIKKRRKVRMGFYHRHIGFGFVN